jgi:hypothetical protein
MTTDTGDSRIDKFITSIVRRAGAMLPDVSHWWRCAFCGRMAWVSCDNDLCPACKLAVEKLRESREGAS